jgi:hypothetical protein
MLALKEKEKERKACLHIPGSLGVSSFLLVPWSFLISSRLCFCSVYLGGGGVMPVSQTESTQAWEVENVMVQACDREDAEGLVCKVDLLEVELAEARGG